MPTSKPEVIVPVASFKKLMAYTDLCDGEVTGFFDVNWNAAYVDSEGSDPRGAFVVGEIYLVKQEAGAASVEMDEDGILDAMDELIAAGVSQMPRGWWHSHVNMAAFFSGTDNNTINNDFLNDTYAVSIVVNKRREMKASVVIFEDLPYGIATTPLRIDELPITVDGPSETIPEELRREVEEKVKPYSAPSGGNTYNYQWGKGEKDSGKKIHTLKLPKEKQKALEKIQTLDLRRSWDAAKGDVVFINDATGEIWEDPWDNIGWDDYDGVLPERKGSFLDSKPVLFQKSGQRKYSEMPRICTKCRFVEGHHRDSMCEKPNFQPVEPEEPGDYFGREYDDYDGAGD